MNFEDAGFEIVGNLITPEQAQLLLSALAKLELEPLSGGIRRIDKVSRDVAELACSPRFISTVQQHLTGRPELVRAIYFDKSPGNNWYVTWHQDRTVSVSGRFAADGWGPWSVKAGALHVQPPLEVLENMATIRLHLDAATISNGCLKVIPGSHKIGLPPADRVHEYVDADQAVYCESPAGGAVIMRPHILHASERSASTMPRRILHFEYSGYSLPNGVCWNG